MASLTVKSEGENFIRYNEGPIKLLNVRFSYPHISKPYAKGTTDDGKPATPKYGIVAMLPKSTHRAAMMACKGIIEEMMAANEAKISKEKWFIRNGDDHESETYTDHWIVSAREERQPAPRNRRGELITDVTTMNNLFYGGAWGHVLIRPWYQDGQKVGKGYGKRINAGLIGVQHIKDDDAFGEGRIDDSEAWGDESGGEGRKSGRFTDDDDL